MSPRYRALFLLPVLLALLTLPAYILEMRSIQNQAVSPVSATSPSGPAYGLVGREANALSANRFTFTPTPTSTPVAAAEQHTPAEKLTGLAATPSFTVAATSLPSPTPLSETTTRQLAVFEELWTTIQREYLYLDFNGLNWEEVYTEYHDLIKSGLDQAQFYTQLDEMVRQLGDEHSSFLSPEEVLTEEAQYAGAQNYVGVGFLLAPVPERKYATVLVTFPGGPAERAGIQAHDNIISANGEMLVDEAGNLRSVIRGAEGTRVAMVIQSPGEEPRLVEVKREQIGGPIPVPYHILTTPGGQRVGYILLVSFADGTVDDQVREALLAMNAEVPLDGLVIDNRQNEGGADTVLRGLLSYFTDGTLGYFVSRQEERPLEVFGENVNGSQEVPLVVLVGKNTYSYGEVFAGILQDLGRALLIGEPTEGNVETLRGYNLTDGSRAWIAHDSFRPVNNPDLDWEQMGIIPDLIVTDAWDQYTLDNDPAVQTSLSHFDQLDGP